MRKKTLLISHQLDFSGAPVALFHLAKALIQINHDVELVSLHRGGGLLADFNQIGVKYREEKSLDVNEYDTVVFNTVVSTPLIPKIKNRKTKFILWIHESPFLAGFAWSNSVNMRRTENVDLIIFPTEACKNEWEGLIDTSGSVTLHSPVDIPDEIKQLNREHRRIVKTYCIIDPRESYRNIQKIEEEILNFPDEAIFNFVGADMPDSKMVSALRSKRNVEVRWHGRVPRKNALEILAKSDIYISATCLATQNRGFCEAIMLNKTVLVSSIKAHVEIGKSAGLSNDSYFYPLGKIDLKKEVEHTDYSKGFLDFNEFVAKVNDIFY